MNFKLLLEWKLCIANCPQKEREIGFCYFTCICVCETVLYLKMKRHSKYTCSRAISVAVLITPTKCREEANAFPFLHLKLFSPVNQVGEVYFSASPLLTKSHLSLSIPD